MNQTGSFASQERGMPFLEGASRVVWGRGAADRGRMRRLMLSDPVMSRQTALLSPKTGPKVSGVADSFAI